MTKQKARKNGMSSIDSCVFPGCREQAEIKSADGSKNGFCAEHENVLSPEVLSRVQLRVRASVAALNSLKK